jgi:hypothetical protein
MFLSATPFLIEKRLTKKKGHKKMQKRTAAKKPKYQKGMSVGIDDLVQWYATLPSNGPVIKTCC